MNSLLRPPLPGPSLCARSRVSPLPASGRLGSAALVGGGRRCRRGLAVAASAAPSWMEEAGVAVLEEGVRRNPSVSDSYRPAGLPRPNATVLEAQGRVCTGPGQTRPLGEEQAMRVLDTILRSAMGELKEEPVSSAQLGAFFAGMTIRANSFPEATQWSEGERRAMSIFWPRLVQVLPPEVKFIADPEGTIMGANGLTGPRYVGQGTGEMRLVGALREVLAGGHLGYEEVQCVLKDILPIGSNSSSTVVSEALLAAFLIGQRMNRETDRELKAYCLAFDDELGPPPVADVKSLTHYGEPYDGNTRFFRSTLFVAAVRACYGESCLLHGVEWMPPKPFVLLNDQGFQGGITEGQILKFMGANINLSPTQAKTLLEDENAGFAYLNLQEACPPLYSIIGLREHIKKRPPLATSEKVQQFVRARGRESMIAGFYHEGYEDPLLMLMRRRTVHAGLVVKGEEGALSMATKERSAHASKGLPVNHCSGFWTPNSINSSETDGIARESFRVIVNAQELGFESTETPRTDRSIMKNLELGLAALGGEKGAAYDRIVLNAAMADHLLGCSGAEDINTALDRAREAIDSGKALRRLMSYIKISHKVT
ncbi:anthranilate phosphoribosyltransferase [Panicum miliaceum]|uniref:Anthranilate phosphoribosyltransferase n=1 Tax=Panicum miliaceum TaxID=4540 RepID=A0A3L6RW87_PANMI|nr:anthranilate phosphoribosyltransferase [Panicum miliaceum]